MILQYFKYLEGPFGCVYSIDNLICEYSLNTYDQKSVVTEISNIFEENVSDFSSIRSVPGCGYWCQERRGRYQYFKHFWAGDGVSVSAFKFRGSGGDMASVFKLEVNPNKHWDKPVFVALRAWMEQRCTAGTLRKYDFACDIPASIDNIVVISRKSYNYINGTRYYGQRNKHGHLRVYDKRSELANKQGVSLDYDLTRCEWTFETTKGCSVSFDDIGVSMGNVDVSAVPDTLRAYVALLSKIRDCLGPAEYELSLHHLNKRTRTKVRAYVEGSHISPCPGVSDVAMLLKWYSTELSIAYSVQDGQWFNSHGMSKCVSLTAI